MEVKKTCPRCGKSFVCRHSADCWCAKITLDDNARAKLKQYDNCLCGDCLNELKER